MEVQLRNREIIKTLDELVDIFFSKPGYDDPKYRLASKNWDKPANPEYYCSETNLQQLLDKWEDHKGFPEEHMAQPISKMVEIDYDMWAHFRDLCRVGMTMDIGAQHAALTNYYPPGGFVGWHTNWNAPAYQILFTWSRTGEGYFRYFDGKKIVTIEDKPGWQVRWYHFGWIQDPVNHCWHSAYTYCDRITLAYKFDNKYDDAAAQLMRDHCVEELETP